MSNKNGRAAGTGATAKKCKPVSLAGCHGRIKYVQTEGGAITITITGRPADNLHRAAKAMNATKWCSGNTAASILRNFGIGDILAYWNEPRPHYTIGNLAEEIQGIVENIDTWADGDEATDKARRGELREAFARAFRFCEHPAFKRPSRH